MDEDKETVVESGLIADMLSSYVPGATTLIWRTGSSEADDDNSQRSDAFTTNLVICGFETITLTNADEPMVINAIRAGTVDKNNKLYVVTESELAKEFDIQFPAAANDQCGIHSFEIIEDDVDVSMIPDVNDLVINVDVDA